MRNWIPASSAAIAMVPPKASTSLTRCPFPIPPIDGLQDIRPSVSILRVRSIVQQPNNEAAKVASVPASPPPNPMKTNRLGNVLGLNRRQRRKHRDMKRTAQL